MFKLMGQMIKIYLAHAESVHKMVEAYHLDEVLDMKELMS